MKALMLAAATALTVACGSPPPLANTHPTPEALATAVIDGMRRGDREALLALALTEQEFRQRVWPELPAARPERNLPFSYVWGDLRQKSGESLRRLLARHKGKDYTLVSVGFGATTPYQSYTVHRESRFTVRTADGAEEEIRLCGSMIEQDGRWKVFSYVVDD